MARNIIYESEWWDDKHKWHNAILCFRHAVKYSLEGKTVEAKVDDDGTLSYVGCKECKKEYND